MCAYVVKKSAVFTYKTIWQTKSRETGEILKTCLYFYIIYYWNSRV